MDKEKLAEFVNVIVFYRGSIINEWIMLEKAIENYIVRYLSTDTNKQIEIAELLLDRIGFDMKRGVFKAILDKKAEENGFKKTKNNKAPHAKLIENLRLINIKRNHFAHYMGVYDESALSDYPEKITLIEFRDQARRITYTQKEYQKIRQDIYDLHVEIEGMATLL